MKPEVMQVMLAIQADAESQGQSLWGVYLQHCLVCKGAVSMGALSAQSVCHDVHVRQQMQRVDYSHCLLLTKGCNCIGA